jgi:hypothetical protein
MRIALDGDSTTTTASFARPGRATDDRAGSADAVAAWTALDVNAFQLGARAPSHSPGSVLTTGPSRHHAHLHAARGAGYAGVDEVRRKNLLRDSMFIVRAEGQGSVTVTYCGRGGPGCLTTPSIRRRPDVRVPIARAIC